MKKPKQTNISLFPGAKARKLLSLLIGCFFGFTFHRQTLRTGP